MEPNPGSRARHGARRLRLLSAALTVLLSSVWCLFAETAEMRFVPVDLHDEERRVSVYDMVQDAQGFMWFATFDGLIRFDGYTTRLFPVDPDGTRGPVGVPRVLHEDDRGRLWVGTDRGASRFDPETMRFRHYQPFRDDPRTLASGQVTSLLCDAEGRLWVGTLKGGLHYYDKKLDIFVRLSEREDGPALASKDIWSLEEGPEGKIWIGHYKRGLELYDPIGGTVTRFPLSGDRGADRIYALEVDSADRLWIGTARGLYRLDGDALEAHVNEGDHRPLPDNNIRDLLWTRDDTLWIATNNGLSIHDPERGNFTNHRHQPGRRSSLGADSLRSLYEDPTGVIWIGYNRAGVDKHVPGFTAWNQESPLDENGNPLGSVLSLMQDRQGRLWIGFFQGGLLRLDPRTGERVHYRHEPGNDQSISQETVHALVEDESGGIWIGTSESLDYLNPETGAFRHYRKDPEDPMTPSSDLIAVLTIDRRGGLWVGGNEGLDRRDPETGRFRSFLGAEVSGDVSVLFEDPNGSLWVGTEGSGLFRLAPLSGISTRFSHDPEDPESLPSDKVLSIHRDEAGRLWIGTDRGLARFLYDGDRFTRASSEDGLDGTEIYSLLSDAQGNLWMSTEKGLSRYVPETGFFENFNFQDTREARYANEFNQGAALRDIDGHLYFGGTRGYNHFSPRVVDEQGRPPRVAITDFLVFNRSELIGDAEAPTRLERAINLTDALTLSYRDTVLTFELAVLDYADPRKNSYAYKLEPFNEDWIYTDARNRYATYTKLDPGDYTFHVRGADSRGVWNMDGATLSLRIEPPFWRTAWFIALQLIAVVALIAGAFIAQRNHLRRKKNEELRALELERQKDEALRRMELERKTAELELAREVQLSMLPDRDIDGSIEVVGRMRTASEVGGDYFDFIDLPEGRGCIAFGDATGHGVTAGLIVGMTKSSLMTLLEHTTHAPDDIVQNVNRALARSIVQRNIGMGLSISLWDPEGSTLHMSSAGMPFPLHYRAGEDRLHPVPLRCPPLGFLRELPVNRESLTLAPGDVVVWLSDGFGERCDPDGRFWAQSGLEAEIARLCAGGRSAGCVAEGILVACDRFARGMEHEDDMTVVVLRVK